LIHNSAEVYFLDHPVRVNDIKIQYTNLNRYRSYSVFR